MKTLIKNDFYQGWNLRMDEKLFVDDNLYLDVFVNGWILIK